MLLKASCGTILAHHSIYFKLLMYYYTVLCHKFNIQFNSINDLSSAEKKPLQDKSSHATYLGVVPLGRSSFIQSYLPTTSHQKPTNKKLQNGIWTFYHNKSSHKETLLLRGPCYNMVFCLTILPPSTRVIARFDCNRKKLRLLDYILAHMTQH